MAPPVAQGPPFSGMGANISTPPREARTMGPACEWFHLRHTGLSQRAVNTIQNARESSTRSLYDCKWRVFEDWCAGAQEIPFQCSIGAIVFSTGPN